MSYSAPRQRTSLHRVDGRRRRTPMSVLELMAGAAALMGGAAMLPMRPRDEAYEPTDADKERLRMAAEKRQRKADRKAENTRRADEGKPPIDPKLSDGGAWRGSCEVRRRRDIRAKKEERTDETGTSRK